MAYTAPSRLTYAVCNDSFVLTTQGSNSPLSPA